MLGPHVAGLHLGLNVPYVTTPKGLLISKPAMAEPSRIWTPDDIAWSPTSFASGHNERDEALGPLSGKYCADLRQVVRRKTRTVTAGPVKFGSDHPIVRQTMGAASTVKKTLPLGPLPVARLAARGGPTLPVGRSCRATSRPAAAGARVSRLQSRRCRRLAARASRLQYGILPSYPGTTSTKDVRGTVEQVMRCADEGFDLVRITVVGASPRLEPAASAKASSGQLGLSPPPLSPPLRLRLRLRVRSLRNLRLHCSLRLHRHLRLRPQA